MKTEIIIEGQTMGNAMLANAIDCTSNSERRQTGFGNYIITFPTRKEAYAALWSAFKKLRDSDREFAKFGMRYSPKYSLTYDASCAVIYSVIVD